MTRLQPISVEGSCGHKFNIIFPTSIKYYLNPEYYDKLRTGEISLAECPYCSKEVVIYYSLIVDTIDERIHIFPINWKGRINEERYKGEKVIYETYGKPFEILINYLKSRGEVDEEGTLSEDYIPSNLREEMLKDLSVWEPKRRDKKELKEK